MMPLYSWHVRSLEGTQAVAAMLASLLQPGDCIALEGTLGAGKTEFARAVLRELSGDPQLEVPSPTFTLLQSYPVRLNGEASTCWHADLYRIEHPQELDELGLEEMLEEGILLVEWPAIADAILPKTRLLVEISLLEDGTREIVLSGDASWQLRLLKISATT